MSDDLYTQEFRKFGPLANSVDSVDQGDRLYRALNCILRPKSGIKGTIRYFRLWGIGSVNSCATTFRALPFSGFSSGVGDTAPHRATNKTVAIRMYSQGKNFLLFFDLVNNKSRGLFYMGDDGTYTSGAYDFLTATPSFEVMAVGLDSRARWYGKRQATMLKLSNNVDDPVCVQLARTAVPGKWRKAASNVAPDPAVISLTPVAKSTNTQAKFAIAPATTLKVLPDAANDVLWAYVAGATCTASATTDRLTIATGYIPVNGDLVLLAGTTAPTGTTLYASYYVVGASGQTCSIATSIGGTKINLTGAGADLVIVHLLPHQLTNSDAVLFGTAGTAPNGLLEQQYFVRDVTPNIDTYSFKITDAVGNSAVTFSDNGTTLLQQTVSRLNNSQRVGGKTLTFTADVDNFPGASGNNRIKVAITFAAYNTVITSTRSGTGATSDPFLYTLNTGPNADGVAMNCYIRTGRFATGDGRMRALIARVSPFVNNSDGSIFDFLVTLHLANYADGDTTASETLSYPLPPVEDYYFVTPYRRARYVEYEFGSNSVGATWEFTGYDRVIRLGGNR